MNVGKFFELEKNYEKKIAFVYFNRPEKRNALNGDFWESLPEVIDEMERDDNISTVLLAGKGKSFSTGLDFEDFIEKYQSRVEAPEAEERERLFNLLLTMQKGLNELAEGKKIYIAAVHSYCIGGALDLIAACDLRFCSQDAIFSLREAKMGIVADMGSLSRLPPIIGEGNTRLMALTGSNYSAQEAKEMGLVNGVYETQEELMAGISKIASLIGKNSSMAVQGTKHILNYGLNHFQKDSLETVCLWNAAFLYNQDLKNIVTSFLKIKENKSK